MKKYHIFQMKEVALNVLSIVILVIMLILTFLLNRDYIFMGDLGWCIILLIPYLIVHELLHSLSYVLHGADFKYITYGAHLEKGILCCLCKENITKKNILTSLIYPFFFIGIVTYVIGMIWDLDILITLSIFNISGCSGDLMMFIGLLKIKDFEYSEYDNPLAFGLYTEEDLNQRKLFGLKYLGSKDSLEKSDLKKVSISKTSYAIFIVLLILGIINVLIG